MHLHLQKLLEQMGRVTKIFATKQLQNDNQRSGLCPRIALPSCITIVNFRNAPIQLGSLRDICEPVANIQVRQAKIAQSV